MEKEKLRTIAWFLLVTLLIISTTSLEDHLPIAASGDGTISIFDIVYMTAHYQTTPESPNWDAACDIVPPWDIVDIFDIVEIAEHYGEEWSTIRTPLYYTYDVIHAYPHDTDAFSQGLVFQDGALYESTGLYGYSSLRLVELESGDVLQLYSLPDQYFAEGITVFDDLIIQLTWKSNVGFVYDKQSFELLDEFFYPYEGWGITHNGSHLIMSDGSATLYFLDPTTFEEVGQIQVYEDGAVTKLNELEYINGKVYANIWKEDKIAIIDLRTGYVEGWIDLEGLRDVEDPNTENVLNGIAYDEIENRLFVTGKRWAQLFEIELVPLE